MLGCVVLCYIISMSYPEDGFLSEEHVRCMRYGERGPDGFGHPLITIFTINIIIIIIIIICISIIIIIGIIIIITTIIIIITITIITIIIIIITNDMPV